MKEDLSRMSPNCNQFACQTGKSRGTILHSQEMPIYQCNSALVIVIKWTIMAQLVPILVPLSEGVFQKKVLIQAR